MSEKKVIHVKDLVIQADNVVFERRPGRQRDPLFEFPRRTRETEEEVESISEKELVEGENKDDLRRPFSWI